MCIRDSIKRGLKIELLEQVVALLAMGEPLPDKNRDHDLSGDWTGHRECHIPVSYTHLFYQDIDGLWHIGLLCLQYAMGAMIKPFMYRTCFDLPYSVSYTHLDVYKRQPWGGLPP